MYGDDYFEHCEIPHSSLKLSHNIGKGAFGSVYLAVANEIGPKHCSGLVAVKKLKSMYLISLLRNHSQLLHFECPNVEKKQEKASDIYLSF